MEVLWQLQDRCCRGRKLPLQRLRPCPVFVAFHEGSPYLQRAQRKAYSSAEELWYQQHISIWAM